MMSLKYELLKCLVKAAGIKKHWVGRSTEELLENRRRQNAKNRIPVCREAKEGWDMIIRIMKADRHDVYGV